MNKTQNSNDTFMEIKVITQERTIKTAGISVLVPKWPPEEPDIFGQLWKKYFGQDISSKIPDSKDPSTQYGILANIDGSIYYLATQEVTTYDNITEDFVKFDIPAGKYAVCTFNAATFEELVSTSLPKANEYLNNIWLPKSDHKNECTFALEIYGELSRRKDYPQMDIWTPVTDR